MTSSVLDPVLLVDDLVLAWFDPVDGTPAPRRGPDGVDSMHRVNALGAAVLVDLLVHGGAELAPAKASKARSEAEARGLAAGVSRVVAAATAPALSELAPAATAMRRYRRPRMPERTFIRLRPKVPESRLAAAGLVEYPGTATARLTPAGFDVARARRAELDGFVLEGRRPDAGFGTPTLRLATLLAVGDVWRGAYRFAPAEQKGAIHTHLAELRAEGEQGPDAAIWRAVGSALRRANAVVIH